MPPSADDQEGISAWRRISDSILHDIDRGVFPAGSKLPPAVDLAVKFGVHRLTILRAINHLQDAGVLRAERGRGTFVTANAVEYRLSNHARFEENMLENRRSPTRRLVAAETVPASAKIAKALDIAAGEDVALITLLSEADGLPISYNANYFSLQPAEVVAAFESASKKGKRLLSTSAVLATLGVSHFRRKTIRLRARPATSVEVEHLRTALGEFVVETEVLNVDDQERPIVFGRTVYASSRVEFAFDL